MTTNTMNIIAIISKKHDRPTRTQAFQAGRSQPTMDTRRMNGAEDGMKLRVKPAENDPSLPEKSKPTDGTQGNPQDQPPQPGRKGFRRMLSGTVSTANFCWFSILMERRTGLNMTLSFCAFANTITRLAGSRKSGWKRSQCCLGAFADSSVGRGE